MIQVTLPGKTERMIYLNPHLIEYAESAGKGRTALLLTNGKRFVVAETPQELRGRIIAYRQEIGMFAQGEE